MYWNILGLAEGQRHVFSCCGGRDFSETVCAEREWMIYDGASSSGMRDSLRYRKLPRAVLRIFSIVTWLNGCAPALVPCYVGKSRL